MLLIDAIKLAGSQSKLAEAIGISQQGVSYMLRQADTISAEVAVAIERVSNGKIKKCELRPDIFGEEA